MRSRLSMLLTPKFEVINGKDNALYSICQSQGSKCIQSLAHIINGCVRKYPYFKARYKKAFDVISEFLKSRDNVVEIYKDKDMHIDDLPSELSGLHLYIFGWSKKRTKEKIRIN